MRSLITDVLDVVGLLLLVAAATVWVWQYSVPAALAVCAVGLLVASLVLDRAPVWLKRWENWKQRRRLAQREGRR